MARSILPSRNRKPARAGKARNHRRARRRSRQAVREEAWDALAPIERDHRHESEGQKWARRGGDKVNHFCRWGRAVTRQVPVAERVAALRAIVGGRGVIVDHALFHFAHAADRSHLERRRDRQRAWRRGYAEARVAQGRPFPSQKALRKRLRQAFARDHAGLNRTLKALVLPGCDPRAPCRQVRDASACTVRLVVRTEQDLLCVAFRLWHWGSEAERVMHHGRRSEASPAVRVDARLLAFFAAQGV